MDLLHTLTTYTESWIEVSSQPSSSSLSSAATDEVVTTGLRVTQGSNGQRRRRLQTSTATHIQSRIANQATGNNESSQEEYEDSESESDRLTTSSNEDLQRGFSKDTQEDPSPPTTLASRHSDQGSFDSVEDDDDDDENTTALGVVDRTPFTPQPHAFSHPPSARVAQAQNTSQNSYFPSITPSTGGSSRQTQINPASASSPASTSRAHTRTRSHTPYNVIAPNHSLSVDHDAALRASLSTLLSCAAAARGLQKRENTPASTSSPSRPGLLQRSRQASRVEPGTLRMIPESALNKVEEQPPTLPRRQSPHSTDSPGSPDPGPAKRKAKSPGRDRRKKHRSSTYNASDDITVSPTLTTWVVGAGVLVLFSAISFSAGYALGKEVGRVDSMGTGTALGCSSEADNALGRGLVRSRAWRWGNTSGVRA
ncbi:hypothetical protein MMC10_000644 [Thelotrema lepadinum]|nr:hypothetical protein [Thelotrema lepadinum]